MTLTVAGVSILSHLLDWSRCFELDRALVAQELWRGLTAHLVHFNLEHLTWDLATWLGLGAIAEHLGRRRMLAATAGAAITISAAVLLLQPQFAVYRGLSGLDSSLFGLIVGRLAVTAHRRRDRPLLALTLLAGAAFLAKCAFEFASEAAVFASSGDFAPVPLAHLVGAWAGLAAACLPGGMRPIGPARAKSATAAANA